MQREMMPPEKLLQLYRSDQILRRIQQHSGPDAVRIFLCQLADERYKVHTIAALWQVPVFTVRLMRDVYTYPRTTLREELGIRIPGTLTYIAGKQEAA